MDAAFTTCLKMSLYSFQIISFLNALLQISALFLFDLFKVA